MQTEIMEAAATQSAPIPQTNREFEPKFDANTPALPSEYQKLTQARVLADRESQTLKVQVKVWHLGTRKLLFSKIYPLATGAYRILDNTTTNENKFLRANEAFRYQFAKVSQTLGESVVRDFLSTQ